MFKKLVIYLDQNFISDIAKLRTGINTKAKKTLIYYLFNEIKLGVNEEKFVVPDSFMIKTETAAFVNKELIKATRDHQHYLGQVSLKHPYEITDAQFKEHLFNFCNTKYEKRKYWETAFEENPDKRMKRYVVDINFSHIDFPFSYSFYLSSILTDNVTFDKKN